MSTMVNRLENLGLITRHREPDERRSDVLCLTEDGDAHVKGIRRVWSSMDRLVIDLIGTENADELTRLANTLKRELIALDQ